MYIVPGVSIIPRPLFRANVPFFDRKNGAYVKIWAIFTGVRPIFSPPGTHDREFSPLIGYNLFPIAADHPCAGIKRPRSAASRRGKKGGEPGKEHENPLLTLILPHPALVRVLFIVCSQKGIRMSHLVRICRTCVWLIYRLLYTCESGDRQSSFVPRILLLDERAVLPDEGGAALFSFLGAGASYENRRRSEVDQEEGEA